MSSISSMFNHINYK